MQETLSSEVIPVGEATEVSIDDCIQAANNEIMADIAHHCDWLEQQRPGLAISFMKHLAGVAAITLTGLPGA